MIVLALFRLSGRIAHNYFEDLSDAKVSLIGMLGSLVIGLTIASLLTYCMLSRKRVRDRYQLTIAALWLLGLVTEIILQCVKTPPSFVSKQVIQFMMTLSLSASALFYVFQSRQKFEIRKK